MKTVFVSASEYPSYRAESMRLHFLIKCFLSFSDDITVITRGVQNTNELNDVRVVRLSNEKYLKSKKFFRGLDYFLFPFKVKRILISLDNVNALVVCGVPTNLLIFLKKYCKKNNIMIIHDAVEWHSKEEFLLGRLDPIYIKKTIWMRWLLTKDVDIISISKYLVNYFAKLKVRSVYVPSILDEIELKDQYAPESQKLKLVYAGSPHKKDYLVEMLNAIALLDESLIDRIDFKIMGVSEVQVIKLGLTLDVLDKIRDSVKFLGIVSREEVFINVEEADFSVLLRSSSQRYAKAGFPTKVPESMMCGTPVICNITSDLGDYLVNGINSIHVDGETAVDFKNALEYALSLTIQDKIGLSYEAKKLAMNTFHYTLFNEKINTFINEGLKSI